MTNKGRYAVSQSAEGQFQPGSHGTVLLNKLGITVQSELDHKELLLLEKATGFFIANYGTHHIFTASDICNMHKVWLDSVYEWAGQYRTVNMEKDGFLFAAAHLVPQLMSTFEEDILKKYTPCLFKDKTSLAQALAETHTELVLIHPFREGNGRISRILSYLMALQAGYDIGFKVMEKENKQLYFQAVQAGMDKNYKPMQNIFKEILEIS